jgi:hydroxymethylbilane synthase
VTNQTIRIATRSSQLALWQANYISDFIQKSFPDVSVEIIHVSTIGDRDQRESLQNFGGMGVFTREVQKAVLENHADLAVHSLKDLPTDSAEGLTLAGVPERAPVSDALILPVTASSSNIDSAIIDLDSQLDLPQLNLLSENSRIGTGSLRRQAQLLHARPDLQLLEIRGNVDTRLKKLDEGEYDAIILAEAGLTRLGLSERITALLNPPLMYPAVGQGALGLECRQDDQATGKILSALTCQKTLAAVTAERALLAALRAGCHAPVGASTRIEEDGSLILEGVVLSPDGKEKLFVSEKSDLENAKELGILVANKLIEDGAGPLLA